MKRLFDKENFIRADFDAKQKKQSLFVSCAIIVLFIAASFAFINALYGFVDAIGSAVSGSVDVALKDFRRSIPIFLCFLMTLWALFLFHAHFRNVSEEKRIRSIYKNGNAILAFAGLTVVDVLLGLLDGKYSSIVEGGPTPIYPLDSILYSLIFIALGTLSLVYVKKWKETHPYVVPSRGPIVTRARFWYCFLVSVWMLFALYSFAAFWYGLFIIDFVHGYQAYSIALILVFLLNACLFICWEFFYNELRPEKRKEYLFPLSLVSLCVSVAVAAFFFIALGFNRDGPANVGFGLLPIAFSASVNIATLLMVAVPVIVSIVALVKGINARKQK